MASGLELTEPPKPPSPRSPRRNMVLVMLAGVLAIVGALAGDQEGDVRRDREHG